MPGPSSVNSVTPSASMFLYDVGPAYRGGQLGDQVGLDLRRDRCRAWRRRSGRSGIRASGTAPRRWPFRVPAWQAPSAASGTRRLRAGAGRGVAPAALAFSQAASTASTAARDDQLAGAVVVGRRRPRRRPMRRSPRLRCLPGRGWRPSCRAAPRRRPAWPWRASKRASGRPRTRGLRRPPGPRIRPASVRRRRRASRPAPWP